VPFYDRIAKQWHAHTGRHGGAFKEFLLNDVLIAAVAFIENRAILELGAGNGYFLPLVLRRYSGQRPARIVITDQSSRQLDLARKYCFVNGAEYAQLDARYPFPFQEGAFDLIIATMVFNEISRRGVASAIAECRRVLRSPGQLLATVIHPDFVASLEKRGELRQEGSYLTMPASAALRLPLHKTPKEFYERCLYNKGFDFKSRDIFSTKNVSNVKAGLKKAGNTPVALLFDCTSTQR